MAKSILEGLTLTSSGNIDWHANGWPEPNPGADTYEAGYSIKGMPDDIFNLWMDECDMLDDGWEADW